MKLRGCAMAALIFGLAATAPIHAAAAQAGLWQAVKQDAGAEAGPSFALAPERYAHFVLDESAMQSLLAKAAAPDGAGGAGRQGRPATIDVPLPNGTMVRLAVEETPIMQAGLAARFPNIKAYTARSADGQADGQVGGQVGSQVHSARLDFTVQGFHAMFSTAQGMVLVDPRTGADGKRSYISYYKHDYHPADKDRGEMRCTARGRDQSAANGADRFGGDPSGPGTSGAKAGADAARGSDPGARSAARTGAELTTYRLAVAATGEYTKYHGGTVPTALSAIVTTINRVNGIYLRDFAIRLQLVDANSSIIYTDGESDPYSNDDGDAMLGENQVNLDRVIGSESYDIGHVFSTDGGGVADLEVPCDSATKAHGVTGSRNPVGAPFDVDYVAHEIGHQFGAEHTFNATTNSCGRGNRNPATAFEPGSGSSVMGYAGICGAENLQFWSDSMFHAGSISQVVSFVTEGGGRSCGTRSALANAAPVANAGPAATIPANTPFVLTGSATDANGDTLSYAWDEMDAGRASTASDMDDEGTRALFRSFLPSSSPVRHFPKASVTPGGYADIGERLPTTSRQLKFRLTVRDQVGGVDGSDVTINVSAAAGPFTVTAPKAGDRLGASTTVNWTVAGTDSAPVNCAKVDISLSHDGGNTFPTMLLAGAPNTGAAMVSFPPGSHYFARLKVQCSDNVFFNLSKGTFNYTDSTATVPGAPTIDSVTAGIQRAVLSVSPPASDGGSAIDFYRATCAADGQYERIVYGYGSPIFVTDLAELVRYSCTVSASNSVGTGPASAAVTVTPNAAGPLPVCTVTASPSSILSGGTAKLTASCSPTPARHFWSIYFDGGPSSGSVAPFFTTVYSVQGVDEIGRVGLAATVTVTVDDTIAIPALYSDYTVAASGAGGSYTLTENATGVSKTLTGIKRLRFYDTSVALDLEGVGGQIYRLYQAAFNRKPDLHGLGFQMWAMDLNGWSHYQVAEAFLASPEFASVYGGNLTDLQFVTAMYTNILQRAPEPDGLSFYLDGLTKKIFTRHQVLAGIAEAPENKALVLPSIKNGFNYIPTGGN